MQRAAVTAALAEAVRQGGSATSAIFRGLVDRSPELVVVTDATLDQPGPYIRYVNPTFTRVTGWPPEEVLGRSPRLLQGPGTDRRTIAAMGATLRAGGKAGARVLNYTRHGTPYWSEMQIVPLLDHRGRVGVFAGFAREVGAEWQGAGGLAEPVERDILTGIPSRQALLRVAEMEFAAQRPGRFCFASLGIDDLGSVRESLGPQAADSVLIGVAGLFARNLRRMDLIGRMGEDSFAVCMPSLAIAEARAVAERLRGAIAGAAFPTAAGSVSVTCSIGIAAAMPPDGLDEVVARADAALREAKREGRNRLTYA